MNQQAVCILLKNMGVGFSEKICVSVCVCVVLNYFIVRSTGTTGILRPHWTIRIYFVWHTGSVFVLSGCGGRNVKRKLRRRPCYVLPSVPFFKTLLSFSLLIS